LVCCRVHPIAGVSKHAGAYDLLGDFGSPRASGPAERHGDFISGGPHEAIPSAGLRRDGGLIEMAEDSAASP
jgi:hypothetical protein